MYMRSKFGGLAAFTLVAAAIFSVAIFRTEDLHPSAALFIAPDTPVRITTPSIQLDTPVITLGLVGDTLQIDTPADQNLAGWFHRSTPPGTPGTTFINGHTPGVFSRLHELSLSQLIQVHTADGNVHTYVIHENYTLPNHQIDLAALLAPGPDRSRLVLMTCAGEFRDHLGTYDHRTIIIAYATP
ncbi:class F sortase [Candidatus Saccharibacteria bacterium]|nr:class F sortase [Candidatus Saccharibacteria bacterium]